MNRRDFVKWLGAAVFVPSLPFLKRVPPLEVTGSYAYGTLLLPWIDSVIVKTRHFESLPVVIRKPNVKFLRELAGLANKRTVTLIENGTEIVCHPETLVYAGTHVTRKIDGWEEKHTFQHREVVSADQKLPGGWNHFYNPSTKDFRRLQFNHSDIYKTADLSKLWT